jgi:hypothetical protein
VSPVRRAASLLLGLALAAGSLKLAACSAVDPNPPDPHEEDSDGDQPSALRKAVDASNADASEATIIDPNPGNPHASAVPVKRGNR